MSRYLGVGSRGKGNASGGFLCGTRRWRDKSAEMLIRRDHTYNKIASLKAAEGFNFNSKGRRTGSTKAKNCFCFTRAEVQLQAVDACACNQGLSSKTEGADNDEGVMVQRAVRGIFRIRSLDILRVCIYSKLG